MRNQNEPCAMTQRVFNAGQCLADACVVDDAAVIERDVEIHTHKNMVIAQGQIADGKLGHSWSSRAAPPKVAPPSEVAPPSPRLSRGRLTRPSANRSLR